MLVKPTAAKVEDAETWERAMQWAMADFGFQNCPIFRAEIVGWDEDNEVVFLPLRCYTKSGPAILTQKSYCHQQGT